METLKSISTIMDCVKSHMPDKRFNHTLNVKEVAVDLAYIYHCHIIDVTKAALLHDIAKYFTLNQMHTLLAKHHYTMKPHEINSLALLHSKASAYYSKELFNINHSIFQSIFYHTTGRPQMSLMEKIIYISDYIEPLRGNIGYISEARQYAYTHIDLALYYCLKGSVEYLSKQTLPIDPLTLETYNYYTHLIQ